MKNPKAKGALKERLTKSRLEDDGWYVTKAGGSLGEADLVALKVGERPRIVQVKSGVGGPYSNFGPEDREKLREVAKRTGAVAELCHWGPRAREPVWIDQVEWP